MNSQRNTCPASPDGFRSHCRGILFGLLARHIGGMCRWRRGRVVSRRKPRMSADDRSGSWSVFVPREMRSEDPAALELVMPTARAAVAKTGPRLPQRGQGTQLRYLVPMLLKVAPGTGGSVDLERVLVPNKVEAYAIGMLDKKGPGWCAGRSRHARPDRAGQQPARLAEETQVLGRLAGSRSPTTVTTRSCGGPSRITCANPDAPRKPGRRSPQ